MSNFRDYLVQAAKFEDKSFSDWDKTRQNSELKILNKILKPKDNFIIRLIPILFTGLSVMLLIATFILNSQTNNIVNFNDSLTEIDKTEVQAKIDSQTFKAFDDDLAALAQL